MIAEQILAIAKTVGVSGKLLLAICTVETGLANKSNVYDRNLGSHGPCQINYRTAKELNPAVDLLALKQVDVSVTLSALYLKKLTQRYRTTDEVINAYNAGYVMKNNKYVAKVNKVLYHQNRR